MSRNSSDPLRTILILEQQVETARAALQRTPEVDPAFERRVSALVKLEDRRTKALASVGRGS
jgi:hypothetical protein